MATNVQDFLKQQPNYVGQSNTANRTPQKKGSKNQSWLSSIISEIGGASGAAGGAAIGTALLPGVGTVIGAGLGGLLGGTGGRLAENKIRDDEYRLGDALKEGAISGALSGAGAGYQAIKGGAKGAAALAGSVDDTGRLASAGGKLRTVQRGIVPGIDQGGGRALSTKAAFAQNSAIDDATKGFKGLTKGSQFTQVEKKLGDVTKAYKLTPEAQSLIDEDEIFKLMQNIEGNIGNNASLRGRLGSAQGVLDNVYDDLSKMSGKSRGDFVDFAAEVNKKASSIVNKGNVGSKEVQVWEEIRNATKNLIDESPSFADKSGLNKQLSTLMGAKQNLSKTITRDQGAGASQGLTVGRLASNIAGSGADILGRGLQAAGRATTGVPAQLVKGTGTRGVVNNMVGGTAVPQEVDTTLYGPQAQGMPMDGAMVDPTTLEQPDQMAMQSPYTLEQALADIQRDPTNQADYMKYYDFVNEATQGGKLTAQEKKAQQQANTAVQGLSQLKSLYSQAGGGQGRLRGIAGNVLGKGGQNSKANSYNQIRNSLTTTLARAFGETGVLTDQDREVYLQALPRLEDNPEEAAAKLQYLEEMLAGSQPGLGASIGQSF